MSGQVTPAGTLVQAHRPHAPENERLPRAAQAPAEASLDSVVIRFAGDSGDGMQRTGWQFATTWALIGNDIATLPDFPAEIRAPAGNPRPTAAQGIHLGRSR